MRYATARYKECQRELAYRIYVTDTIMMMSQSQGRTDRFFDRLEIVDGKRSVDKRSGDEIAADVINRAGLVVE